MGGGGKMCLLPNINRRLSTDQSQSLYIYILNLMIFTSKQAPPYFLFIVCSTADDSCEHKSTLVSQIHKKLKNVLTLAQMHKCDLQIFKLLSLKMVSF